MVASSSSASASVSTRKARANRRNARSSTGPKSPEGRRASSRNAIRHGVYCSDAILPGESKANYAIQLDGFVRDLCPMGPTEMLLVERVHVAQWRLARLHRMEQNLHESQMQQMAAKAEEQLRELDHEITYRCRIVDEMRRRHENNAEIQKRILQERDDSRAEQMRDREDLRDQCSDLRNLFGQLEDPEAAAEDRRRLLRSLARHAVDTGSVQAAQAMAGDKLTGLLSVEQISRIEQRLESSIRSNLRELRQMRDHRAKHPKREPDEFEPARSKSPYAMNPATLLHLAADEVLEKTRNEATDDEDDDNDRPEEELEQPAQAEPARPVSGSCEENGKPVSPPRENDRPAPSGAPQTG